MKISDDIPEVFYRFQERFGVTWGRVIIPWVDTVYCGSKVYDWKLIHEQVHLDQQAKLGKDVWLEKYLDDNQFRLEMELEAYRAEASWIRENISDRNLRVKLITFIQRDISSPMYDGIITSEEARKIFPI